jgi:hypothetical protein
MVGIEVNTEFSCGNFVEEAHKVTLITNTSCEDYKNDFLFAVTRQTSFILAVISRSKRVNKEK